MESAKSPIRKHVLSTQPLGKKWGTVVQGMVTKEAIKQARALLKGGGLSTEAEVEIAIPVFLHLSFARRGKLIAGDAGVRCACTFTQDSSGSVCICVGPGAADCDCGPIVV
jgi:hypothetical protein